MGYQLWTSPITGYRRKGTRLEELRSLLGSGITAHAIIEPLQSCAEEAPSKEIYDLLKRRDFDVTGVQSQRDGPVIGFVARKSLKDGFVRDHLQPITAELLISDFTPLPTLLSVLKERQHVFVLIGSEVRGIVTRADLNKPPVRVYLFGIISLLEMHLSFWARVVYGEDSWQCRLNPKRIKAAKKIQCERRRRNQEMSLLECLQFCDKRDLIIARDDLREKLHLGTKSQARALLKRAEDLRNLLAHSQKNLVHRSSWPETIDLVELVEAVVHTSDEQLEQEARNSAEQGEDGLWQSA